MARVLLFFLFATPLCFFSQIGPRVWQDHISLNRCNSVSKLGSKIYASNGVGVVRFDEAELSPEAVTKINGLHDVGVKLVRANNYNNKLLVIFDNCNIDVIDLNGNISNYPDFKLKIFAGKKIINEATFFKQYAYLACGFGIVMFDTEKQETKETFIIGPGGSNLEVYQVALNDSLIFAATPLGLFKSNHKTKDLNNFNNWLPVAALPAGAYSGVVQADGKVLAAYSPNKANPAVQMQDTLYILNNNTWSRYQALSQGYTVYKMGMTNGPLFSMLNDFGLLVVNVNTGAPSNFITSYNGNTDFKIVDAYFGKDHLSNLAYWCADMNYGLYQTYSYHPFYSQDKVSRNGINQALVNNIDVYNGKIAVSPSHPDVGGGRIYSDQGINIYKNDEWTYIKQNDLYNNKIPDITYVYFDRKDSTKVWASSWSAGLLEYKNNKLIAVHNATNSPMKEVGPGDLRPTGIDMDEDGNLWFAVSDVNTFINVRRRSGVFQSFDMGPGKFTRKIMVDKNNYVWAIHEREGGITVFKHNNFSTPILNNNYKVLTKDVNNGNLQSNSVFSIAEDKDGKIWVGTAAGVVVFYNPTNIFSSSGFDAQPIKIVQDGNVELLLSKEVVTAIVVDGANNKWIGTQTGGVYCFSSDGLTQLYHFTKENSPLYSNAVIDINYYEKTGDVFFGTELGLQSFRSLIVGGEEKYNGVFAYPNPVRPNYSGTVLVRGLVDNSIVKITDESGNIVWETKSNGGQIEWNVTTFSGNRVTSGVYLVYATTTTADQKAVAKILVIN
jgi:hypothetical protein